MVRNIRKFKSLILSLFILVILLSPKYIIGDKILVHDKAKLFTEEEIMDLDMEARRLLDIYNMDIVILTIDDAEGKTSREYGDDFFDYEGYGIGEDFDGILFLIDMDNREAYISTHGKGIRYLTDERIENILNLVFDRGLNQGDYYKAAKGFLAGTATYLDRGIPSDQYNEPEEALVKNTLTKKDIIISLVGSGTISLFSFLGIKTRYSSKPGRNPFPYKNNSLVNFSAREDKLIDSYVRHRVIPKNDTKSSSSTSGRSTTHKSSSGRTHGGGGRKF